MDSLRLFGEFIGIPEDSPKLGAPLPIGLALGSRLLESVADEGTRRSLRGMIGRLATLPPVTLNARLTSPAEGVEPLPVRLTLDAGEGCVLFTWFDFKQVDGASAGGTDYLKGRGIDRYETSLGPGEWDVTVHRTGIDTEGYRQLTQTFRLKVRRERQPAPPVPRPMLVRPTIEVVAEGDGLKRKFKVKGHGFLPSQPAGGITVRAVNEPDPQDWIHLYTSSDAEGQVELTTGELDISQLQRNAFGQAIVAFSACDSRLDPNSVPAGQSLWTNTERLIL
jgi:hypothetical protein